MPYRKHSMECYSGQCVDLAMPSPQDINFHDIAWHLSRISRYNGATHGEYVYSVAQHSVWAAWAAQKYFNADSVLALQILMHDAHEAYTGDLHRPLKLFPEIRHAISIIEDKLDAAIFKALRIPEPIDDVRWIIDECDRLALAVEAHHLMASNGKDWPCMEGVSIEVLQDFWTPLPPSAAFEQFWIAYETLKRDLSLDELLCA